MNLFIKICSLAVLLVQCNSQSAREKPLKLTDIVPENYDKLKPPKERGGPVTVDISVSILTIRGLDAQQLSYDADIFFHQYWTDPRIRLPKSYPENKTVLDNKWRDEIWTPDTFFKNSRDGKVHNIIIPYTYLVLDNNSEIFFASRLSLKLNCEMDLSMFPHDQQECEISIMSLQYSTETVILNWKRFYITKNIMLPQYKVLGHSFGNCTKRYKDIGEFSCLVGKIRLGRRLAYFLINKFIPSVLIVCMSFVTFWIPPSAYPARVTLSVTSILTIVTQQYQSSIPSVSYVMALNIWIMGCIAFVFFTLLEYAVVVVLMDIKDANNSFRALFNFGFCKKKSSWDVTKKDDIILPDENPPPATMPTHLKVDKASRILFPLCFLIFVVTYWSVFTALKRMALHKPT